MYNIDFNLNILQGTVAVLPDTPLDYGDTRVLQNVDNRMYMHYPSHLFEMSGNGTTPMEVDGICDSENVFEAVPGTGLKGSLLFQSSPKDYEDRYMQVVHYLKFTAGRNCLILLYIDIGYF